MRNYKVTIKIDGFQVDISVDGWNITEAVIKASNAVEPLRIKGFSIEIVKVAGVQGAEDAAHYVKRAMDQKKLWGIKLIRELSGCGLKEAKDAYEKVIQPDFPNCTFN